MTKKELQELIAALRAEKEIVDGAIGSDEIDTYRIAALLGAAADQLQAFLDD